MYKSLKKGCVLLACGWLAACEKPTEPAPPPRPVLAMQVKAASPNSSMALVGEVHSRYVSNQGFRVGGKVTARKVEVGSVVKKGQVIASVDGQDAHLNAAAAGADIRAAEASVALAQANLTRKRALYQKNFVSAAALDGDEAQVKTANARLAQAKAQAMVLNNQAGYAHLYADREGVVTMVRAEPGQVVGAGEVVVQIVDPHALEVLVAVPELRIAAIKQGDPVYLRLWADRATKYSGVVREVSPAANSNTRAFDVRIAIQNADEKVKLGMTAGVVFGPQVQELIMVPTTAVTLIKGQKSVWVITEKNTATPRAVQTGDFSEEGVAILSGLKAGETIAIAGVHTLVNGQNVSPRLEMPDGY